MRTTTTAAMSPEAFKDWMLLYRLTIPRAAEVLGLAQRTISGYRDGTSSIPRVAAMAVWASAHGYPPPP